MKTSSFYRMFSGSLRKRPRRRAEATVFTENSFGSILTACPSSGGRPCAAGSPCSRIPYGVRYGTDSGHQRFRRPFPRRQRPLPAYGTGCERGISPLRLWRTAHAPSRIHRAFLPFHPARKPDVVQKEMYTFADSRERSMTLRPEATAGVMRAYIEHGVHARESVSKFFTIGPMFRHERPQKGRMRQFHQINCECLGPKEPGSGCGTDLHAHGLPRQAGSGGNHTSD